MSGIVGIAHFDGKPVGGDLLCRLSAAIACRGPDRQATWAGACAGFGHALLALDPGADLADGLFTIDGRTWITSDARIDARPDLVTELNRRGRQVSMRVSDAALILHAYQVWGAACVEHLLGDFAFAIWDDERQRLFCGRDRFGLKPFFYAALPHAVVFGNTLDCLRLHPDLDDGLDERTLADVLLFDRRLDPSATCFAGVKRLAPAHSLTCDHRGSRTVRYWAPQTGRAVRYRRTRQYVEHFQDVLSRAVSDRVRAPRVGLWLSGGLDSTSIASTLLDLSASERPEIHPRAYTVVWDRVIPDREGEFASIASSALGLDLDTIPANDYVPFEQWHDDSAPAAEPDTNPFTAARRRQWRRVAERARVVLDGTGGDELLSPEYMVHLPFSTPPGRLLPDLLFTTMVHRQRPAVGLRMMLAKWRGHVPAVPPLPDWLSGDLVSRHDIQPRWNRWHAGEPSSPRLSRGHTHAGLAAMQSWASFEDADPGVTGVPIETALPFLDLRVIDYLAAIPPLPWCVNKQLLRVAMRGRMPDAIRRRPKTPLQGDPLAAHLARGTWKWPDRVEADPRLAAFVDVAALSSDPLRQSADPWPYARILALNHWLQQLTRSRRSS